MKHQSKYLKYSYLLLVAFFLATGCREDEEYAVPVPKDVLQNDALKRTLGPNLVGQNIEFAYAMAILPQKGKLVSAEVEASIAGAPETYLENRSFYTSDGGLDIGVSVGLPSVNTGAKTSVTFNVDTSAATLRYYYRIPEAARGQSVSFTFTAKSTNGETVSYKLGPYLISSLDIKRNIPVTNNNFAYISIADMDVYNATDAANNPAKIDLIYLFRNTPATSLFNHAIVAPTADPIYLPGVTLPAGVNNNTKIIKTFNMADRQLSLLGNAIYLDDPDFQKLDFSPAANFAINLRAEAGIWVETADGKYRAYVYINSVNANGSAIISMKRYTMN